jgi:hypothetical protein
MLTITQIPISRTSEFALPFGPVAAACPPLKEWARSAVSEQPGAQVRIGEAGQQYAGVVGTALLAGVAAGNSDAQLHRPFTTMSRRDPRTWRPPH